MVIIAHIILDIQYMDSVVIYEFVYVYIFVYTAIRHILSTVCLIGYYIYIYICINMKYVVLAIDPFLGLLGPGVIMHKRIKHMANTFPTSPGRAIG